MSVLRIVVESVVFVSKIGCKICTHSCNLFGLAVKFAEEDREPPPKPPERFCEELYAL